MLVLNPCVATCLALGKDGPPSTLFQAGEILYFTPNPTVSFRETNAEAQAPVAEAGGGRAGRVPGAGSLVVSCFRSMRKGFTKNILHV